ncbi:MAG: hypothetical protein JNM17_20260 [Archangium sp.]|nr:hypothetical protein [Archangium sp.]
MIAFGLALTLAAAPVAEVTVTPDLKKSELAIELRTRDWTGDCLCLDKPVAAAITGLTAHPDREDCFLKPAKEPLKYTVSLSRLRRFRDDPDFAAELGPAWLFHDSTFLLRLDGADAEFKVKFVLPQGISTAAPWPQEADGTYTVSVAQFDVGSYVALGKLRTLGTVTLEPGHFPVRITLVDEAKKATDAQLISWVTKALETHATFFNGSPTLGKLPIHVVLAGVSSSDAGVFGSVLRRGEPSVMLLFGKNATGGFDSDWVSVHELFHIGNPPTRGRFPWLTEGFTTYYTEILRARSGTKSENAAWATLAESFRDYCAPNGRSLSELSATLGQHWEYQRVYWGGACLAFRLDVAIRQKSKGTRSLDDVMRELRVGEKLDEEEMIAALDRAAGSKVAASLPNGVAPGGLASGHLNEKKRLDIEPLLKDLGIGAVSGDSVKLSDDAPLAKMRKAMTLRASK